MTACETYECTSMPPVGPYAYPERLPPPPSTVPSMPGPSSRRPANLPAAGTSKVSRRPTITLHMPTPSTTTTGDYTSYSALSPTHAKTPRTMYRQLALARSTEVLPSPLRLRSPIPISTSSSNLPLSLPLPDVDYSTVSVQAQAPIPPPKNAHTNGGLGRETSKLSTLLSSLSISKAAWKRQENARLQTIHKQRMSNGTANFYFPPEEQEWDPKAIKRLSKIGSKNAV